MSSKLQDVKHNFKWWIALLILIPATFHILRQPVYMAVATLFYGFLLLLAYILIFISGMIFPWKFYPQRIFICTIFIIAGLLLMIYGVETELIQGWLSSVQPFMFLPVLLEALFYGLVAGVIWRLYELLLSRTGISRW
jgi:hypothetical protein